MNTSNSNASVSKVRGNALTESVIGASAKQLEKATAALNAAISQAQHLNSDLETTSLKIVEAEQRLNELRSRYEEQERSLKVEVDLNVKAHTEAAVKAYLEKLNQLPIDKSVWEKTNKELTALKSEFDSKLHSEKSAALSRMKENFENETKLQKLEYEKKEAENLSNIQFLQSSNARLTAEIEQWKKQLEEERKASVERSKTAPSINVTSAK